jgi:hypothetical protein
MHRHVRLIGLVLFAVALATLVYGTALAESDGPRPFKASSYEVVTAERPSSICPAFEVHSEGSGEGTHLGRFTVQRFHCFTPPGHPAFTGAVIHDGRYTITAANGDQLWGSYSGSLAPTAFDANGMPIRGIITSPSTIEGGTGRFVNAQGDYLAVGDYDLVAEAGSFTFDGWISK